MAGDRDARADEHARMLGDRVRKRHRHLRKWARRTGVTCYRIYDRDIPEIPLALDLYTEDSGARHLYLAYYQKSAHRDERPDAAVTDRDDERRHRAWCLAMAEAATRVLTGDRDESIAVHIKQRQRQRGNWQYQRTGSFGRFLTVKEGEARLLVNLDSHLDTGLFLDHRPLRARIATEARGAHFLNLFCYTGAITVAAALGGALGSESVDLSQRYLAWARDNLAANDIDERVHRLVRADVLEYLGGERARAADFDLAVLDPPTFSNSKKMRGVLDIQRDHARLIAQTLSRLRPGGVLYFSCNYRRFKLAIEGVPGIASVADISAETIPEDFRNRRIHRCWRIVASS